MAAMNFMARMKAATSDEERRALLRELRERLKGDSKYGSVLRNGEDAAVSHSAWKKGRYSSGGGRASTRGIAAMGAGAGAVLTFSQAIYAYEEGFEMSQDIYILMIQLRNASDRNEAYAVAMEIAVRVARVYGSAAGMVANGLLDAWSKYRAQKRAERLNRDRSGGGGSGGSTGYISDWGPLSPLRQGLPPVDLCR